MSAEHDALPAATVVKPPAKVGAVIAAALFAIAIGAVVGFVLGYLAAFVVVKIGILGPGFVVGLPLIVVAALAWATVANQTLRDGAITAIAAGAIAVALIAVWKPADPASLFTTNSKITDVHVSGGQATVTMQSKRDMTVMPPAGATFGYATLLACFAVLAATVGQGAVALRKRDARPF
jgi:hypothetical protein